MTIVELKYICLVNNIDSNKQIEIHIYSDNFVNAFFLLKEDCRRLGKQYIPVSIESAATEKIKIINPISEMNIFKK